MRNSYESVFREYLQNNMEFAGWAWQNSAGYKRVEEKQEALQKRLLSMIPPKKRKKAFSILEELDASYNHEVDFYYDYGIHDGMRILRILGVL